MKEGRKEGSLEITLTVPFAIFFQIQEHLACVTAVLYLGTIGYRRLILSVKS